MRALSLASPAPFLLGVFCLEGLAQVQKPWEHGKLVVADNRRFLRHDDGTPFFWLGDTAWRLLQRLDRREVETYFTNRRRNGFNVVQVVAAWSKEARNAYDRLAFTAGDMVQPAVTSGNNPEVPGEYDFWDHLDYAFDRAADNGIYIALLPVWGSLVKGSIVNEASYSNGFLC